MLKLLRKKHIQKRLIVALAAIIIPAFVLWGSGGLRDKRIAGSSFVGTIDNRKIKIDEFAKAKSGMQIQLILRYLGQREVLDKILTDRMLMNKLTWDRIVMLETARKKGITVNDQEVVEFITKHPLFLNNGVFDQKFYNYMIKQNLGTNPRAFEEQLRNSLKIAKFRDDAMKNISVSDNEILQAYINDFQKGKITYLSIDKKTFEDNVSVEEGDISAYYETHKSEFVIPEKINLEFVGFPFASIEERQFMVTKLKGLYKKRIQNDPEGWARIEKETGAEMKDTGFFSREVPPEIFNFDKKTYESIFSMNIAQADVFYDEAAYGSAFIVRVKEKTPQRIETKDDVRQYIIDKVREGKAESIAREKATKASHAIETDGITLEDAATKFGLKILTTEFITRYDYLEEVGDAVAILDRIFVEQPGFVSPPIKTRKGYIIAQLDMMEEIDMVAYAEKKEEYGHRVLSVKKSKAAQEWFSGISQNAHLQIDLKYL